MPRITGRCVVCLFCSILAAASLARIVPDKTYDFKASSKKGDIADYTYEVNLTLSGHAVKIDEKMHREVTDSKSDGSYTIKQTRSESVVTSDGVSQPDNTTSDESVTYDGIGLITADSDKLTPAQGRSGNLTLFLKPQKPVGVGQSWTISVPGDKKFVPVPVTATYTVVGEESVGAFKTIRVKFEIKETEGDHPASNQGEIWIGEKDSRMVKAKTNYTNLPLADDQIIPSATFEAIRVK